MSRILYALLFIASGVGFTSAQDAPVARTLPVVCPDLSPGPCKLTANPGLVIGIDQRLLACLEREKERPWKCFDNETTTDFDWLENASVVNLPEFGSGGATLLSSDRLSFSDFLNQTVPEIEVTGTTGVFIPEICLVAHEWVEGEWVEGMVPPECQGAVGALQSAGLDLIKLPTK